MMKLPFGWVLVKRLHVERLEWKNKLMFKSNTELNDDVSRLSAEVRQLTQTREDWACKEALKLAQSMEVNWEAHADLIRQGGTANLKPSTLVVSVDSQEALDAIRKAQSETANYKARLETALRDIATMEKRLAEKMYTWTLDAPKA